MTDKADANGSTVTEELPTFDWEGISHKALREYDKAVSDLADLNLILSAKIDDDASKSKKRRFNNTRMKALSDIEMVQKNRDQHLRSFVVSLPRSWLVRDAPDTIPEGEYVDYMRSNMSTQLNTELHRQNVEELEDIKK